MIARINGVLIQKTTSHAVIEANGVGYRVFVPLTTFCELPETGQNVALNIYTHVKDDAIHLFGFHSSDERDIFQLMISVSGIGPKLAINILSGISGRELLNALSQSDLKRLTTIPGIGKKMAERMILELKDKACKLNAYEPVASMKNKMEFADDIRDDALSALINLGYKEQAAVKIIDKLCNEDRDSLTLDLLLKRALKELAG
jgi:holliday junction DNA helicase RuvA